MQAGEKHTATQNKYTLTVNHQHPADAMTFMLERGKLKRDEDLIFFNNPRSLDQSVTMQGDKTFDIDLSRVAPQYDQIIITLTSEQKPLRENPALTIEGSGLQFDAKPYLQEQRSVMLLKFYRHNGTWKLSPIGQGFNGGLDALVKHFGGTVAEPATQGQNTTSQQPAQTTPAVTTGNQAISLKKEQQKINLRKAEQHNPSLVPVIERARISLEKKGLDDMTFHVKLILDISASMSDEYRSGAVQELANRALALAARLDDDAAVEVYLFGIQAHRKGSMDIANARDFVKNMRVRLEGGTEYGPVMQMVREDARYQTKHPHLNLFITDGGTSNARKVIDLMREMSSEPMFWKFMGIQQGGFTSFDFLEKLDDLTGRTVDNADFFKVRLPFPPDDQLFDLLVNELDTWLRDARRAGVLR